MYVSSFRYRSLYRKKWRKSRKRVTWLFGIACSVIQVMRGEHFMSHTLATALFDWLTCALLYCVFFSKEIWQQFIVKNRAEDGGSTGGPMLREAVAPVRIEDRGDR